jgi:hypothetical protein
MQSALAAGQCLGRTPRSDLKGDRLPNQWRSPITLPCMHSDSIAADRPTLVSVSPAYKAVWIAHAFVYSLTVTEHCLMCDWAKPSSKADRITIQAFDV